MLCPVLPTSPSPVLQELSGERGQARYTTSSLQPTSRGHTAVEGKGWPEPDSSFHSGFLGHYVAATLSTFVLSSLLFVRVVSGTQKNHIHTGEFLCTPSSIQQVTLPWPTCGGKPHMLQLIIPVGGVIPELLGSAHAVGFASRTVSCVFVSWPKTSWEDPRMSS